MSEPTVAEQDRIAAFWDKIAAYTPEQWADMCYALGRAAMGRGATTSQYEDLRDSLQEVADHLDLILAVDPDQIGPDLNRKPEIVISPDGLPERFPVVLRIVDAAPPEVRERFDIRAGRPRAVNVQELRVRTGGRDWSVDDITWEVKRRRSRKGAVNVVLYVPGYNPAVEPEGNREPIQATFLLLDAVLGEWTVMMHLGEIEWRSDLLGKGKPSLPALAEYLDSHFDD